jgi:acetone carboxylase gamma subunit
MSARLAPADRLLPLVCRACGHAAAAGRAFLVRERPMRELGPLYTTGPETLLREVICPACGALADSQVVRAGAPVLVDTVTAP